MEAASSKCYFMMCVFRLVSFKNALPLLLDRNNSFFGFFMRTARVGRDELYTVDKLFGS